MAPTTMKKAEMAAEANMLLFMTLQDVGITDRNALDYFHIFWSNELEKLLQCPAKEKEGQRIIGRMSLKLIQARPLRPPPTLRSTVVKLKGAHGKEGGNHNGGKAKEGIQLEVEPLHYSTTALNTQHGVCAETER